MTEKENLCSGCENNCCHDFILYWKAEEIATLLEEYPFLHVKKVDVGLVGKREKMYRVMECDRLLSDNSCQNYPLDRPSFCEITGITSRPTKSCQLNDSINKNITTNNDL